ncbi:MAG: hypothetical protein HUJ25_04980 [Crocinitomicaceae bacterium]|nr:hypothetical protein [Crocinitomicaceae bacterium]
MKKILGLAFALMIGALTFGQSPVTFTEDLSSFDKNSTTEFHFTFDNTISGENISKNSSFYTDYFEVVADQRDDGHAVAIVLNQDDEISRKVIQRFFVSLQVKTIMVDGNDMDLNEFMETYIHK